MPASKWCFTTCRPATSPQASAVSPACRDAEREFRDGVERAIEYARLASCPRLNCLAGVAPADREHFGVLVENATRRASSALPA